MEDYPVDLLTYCQIKQNATTRIGTRIPASPMIRGKAPKLIVLVEYLASRIAPINLVVALASGRGPSGSRHGTFFRWIDQKREIDDCLNSPGLRRE